MPEQNESKQHVPIFIGSTYEDLKLYRAAVTEALVRMEHIVRGMEYFGSKPGSPREECIKAVQSCRIYIGIFAMRYGSVDEGTGKSMTHLEYEEARRLGLPTLIYLLDEQNQPVLPGHVDKGENAERLRNLKDELRRRHTVSFFTTPEDLARRIVQDLSSVLAFQAAGEARLAAEEAETRRAEAESAALVARVYFSLSAALANRFDSGYEVHRDYAKALLTLAGRPDQRIAVSFGDFTSLLTWPPPTDRGDRWRANVFEIVRQLEREGLVRLDGDAPENAYISVTTDFVEPMRVALSYLHDQPHKPT